jgi:hypothetical protein
MAIRMVKVAPFGWAVTATKWHYWADSGRWLSGSMLSGRGPSGDCSATARWGNYLEPPFCRGFKGRVSGVLHSSYARPYGELAPWPAPLSIAFPT